MTTKVSNTFKEAIKDSPFPRFEIAVAAGLHPSTLSQLLCGIREVKPEDPRIIAVGAVLGLKGEECFTEQEGAHGQARGEADF